MLDKMNERKERKREEMNELAEQVKTKSLGFWSWLVEVARECDDPVEMMLFVLLFGFLTLTGFCVVCLLCMVLIYAPWIFLAFLVSFGIPVGFLAWVKMKDKKSREEEEKKDDYGNDGM